MWYKRAQEKAITYWIRLMPFRVIALHHSAHGLCIPDFGLATYNTIERLLLDVIWMCMPDDNSEITNNIRDLQTCYTNWFKFLWYAMKVVAQIMENHVNPRQPVYKAN